LDIQQDTTWTQWKFQIHYTQNQLGTADKKSYKKETERGRRENERWGEGGERKRGRGGERMGRRMRERGSERKRENHLAE
jgi:hypothetical protein